MATQTTTAQNIYAPKTSTSKAPPSERIRTYKEFLTPALHRRFTTAAAVLLLFCWIDAVFFSTSSSYLWMWFPIGATGVRTLMLFIACLAVFVVRVAGLHVGERTTTSTAETILRQVAGAKNASNTAFTVGGYLFSAWWFGEIFLWSRNESSLLGMLEPAQTYERPRLNENPIFLRCLFPLVALAQAVQHFRRDYDRARIPIYGQDGALVHNELAWFLGRPASTFEQWPSPFKVLTERCWTIFRRMWELSFLGILGGFITYFVCLRKIAWAWSYSIARPLVRELPPSANPGGLHGWRIVFQTALSIFALIGLWEVSNAVFDAVATEKPLKKGEPLTSEIKDGRGLVLHKSKDPNGSLITGLTRKNEVTKSFAFWELYMICTDFEKRRKTIYAEVDRKDGSTWSKICAAALKQVEGMQTRIKVTNEPVDYKKTQADLELQRKQHQHLIGYERDESLGLKKIADQGVNNNGDVFAKQKPDLVNTIGNMAKSIGQSPGGEDPVSARARKALQWGTDHVLSQEEQQRLSREHLQSQASGYMVQLLQMPVGIPFRQPFARRVKAVIFGQPYSNQANIIHATKSLTRLAVCSLSEDTYGQVQTDIGKIVRTFTETIQVIEKFVKELQPSWTDVTFSERDRDVREVKVVVDVLKSGLEEIILAFGEYTNALGLSKKEVREAKEAAAKVQPRREMPPPPPFPKQPEMQQTGGRGRQQRV